MINYAVIGAGWISQQAFLPGIGRSGNSRVAAIVTGDRARAARLADFYGIDAVVGYDGYDALLASPEIDAVYVALPNDMHADYAIRAARAGKHILVEKPLAVSEDEALAMIAAARARGELRRARTRLNRRGCPAAHSPPCAIAFDAVQDAGFVGLHVFEETDDACAPEKLRSE